MIAIYSEIQLCAKSDKQCVQPLQLQNISVIMTLYDILCQ